ncbi:MAG TPA: threonine synthase, partial [Lacipirellulaceae bacterium]
MASRVKTKTDVAFQRCVMPDCAATYDVGDVRTSCQACGALLDIDYDWDSLPIPASLRSFEDKWSRRNEPLCLSGVWRFQELLPFAPASKIVTIGEGQTLLQPSDGVAQYVGVQPG